MKLKSLLLAFPVLCVACSSPPSDTSDPAYQMDANPVHAKEVVGVHALVTDFAYEQPCTIIGEDFFRETFGLEESVAISEEQITNGCEMSWGGNKVVMTFGGRKPFMSLFEAAYQFKKMYMGMPTPEATTEAPIAPQGAMPNSTEGQDPSQRVTSFNAEGTKADSAKATTNIQEPKPMAEPAEGKGEPVAHLGDQAIWDASTGWLHVLYSNHLINVRVEAKGSPEKKKEQAEALADVLIEKIAENEYITRLQ